MLDDPAHVWEKTHVEHAIDFVEHKNLDVAKIQRPLLEQIEKTAGRCRDDIDTARGFFALFAVADTAVHDRDTQIGEPAVIAKSGFDLSGQLTGRL